MKTWSLCVVLLALSACAETAGNVGTSFRASLPVAGELIFE